MQRYIFTRCAPWGAPKSPSHFFFTTLSKPNRRRFSGLAKMSPVLKGNAAPLGEWVDDLFNKVYFQPDDKLAMEAFEEGFASDFSVRINQDHFTRARYLEIVKHGRAANTFVNQSNDEVTVWKAPDGAGGGCVAHMGIFLQIQKVDGKELQASALTVANVQIRDDKRVLLELTEVMNL